LFHRWIQGGLATNAIDLVDVLSFPVQNMDAKAMRKIPDGKALAFIIGAESTSSTGAGSGYTIRGLTRMLFSQK